MLPISSPWRRRPQILRIGRNQAYELARVWRATGGERGVPVVEFGRLLRVPKAALLRLAGLGRAARGGSCRLSPRAAVCAWIPGRCGLGYRLGSDSLLVLLDLAAHATDSPEGIVVAASYRDVARRLGISKDTVGRRMALLRQAGVVVELTDHSVDRFETRSYRLYLDFAGVARERAPVGCEPLGEGDRRSELGGGPVVGRLPPAAAGAASAGVGDPGGGRFGRGGRGRPAGGPHLGPPGRRTSRDRPGHRGGRPARPAQAGTGDIRPGDGPAGRFGLSVYRSGHRRPDRRITRYG